MGDDAAAHRVSSGYWLRVAVVCVAAALFVTILIIVVGQTSSVSVTLRRALIHSLVMAGLVASLMPRLHDRLDCFSTATRWAARVATLLALATVGTLFSCSLIRALGLGRGEPLLACFTQDVPINLLLTLTLGLAMTFYEAQRFRLHAVTLALRTQELEHERARKMALEARLASLESRLQPHFLFNTLNAISALIQESPNEAERTLERLAALLRFSLDATGRGLVPLAHELKIVADYLEIEKVRFGERLTYAIDADDAVLACEVPPLAIQTLVENSVKHAVAPRPEGGRVRVAVAGTGDRVILTVRDDGPGFTLDAARAGHGLDNLQARLTSRFGEAASLHVMRHGEGTVVTVSLPRAATP